MERREMLLKTGAAVLGLSAFPLQRTAAVTGKNQKVLYYSRSIGYEHSVVRRQGDGLSHSDKVLIELGKKAGFEVDCTKDGGVFEGDLEQYDAIAFFTCCGDLTRPNKRNTPPMSLKGKQRLLDAIAAGKGFVGFHCTSYSWPSRGPRDENQTEVDPFIAMVGGEFVGHGPQQEAEITIASPNFPGMKGLGKSFKLHEEWLALKNFAKNLHVILLQETEGMKGGCYQRPPYPTAWARPHGKGRIFYTSLAHREETWSSQMFQQLVSGGFAWALGNVQAEVAPNIDKVAPNANRLKNQEL